MSARGYILAERPHCEPPGCRAIVVTVKCPMPGCPDATEYVAAPADLPILERYGRLCTTDYERQEAVR